jgi:hypothetical protein
MEHAERHLVGGVVRFYLGWFSGYRVKPVSPVHSGPSHHRIRLRTPPTYSPTYFRPAGDYAERIASKG